eukprot:TRINITY_DN8371_c0_g1_i1.p1 TRINITY_DN8371_c0_g1~~TRINITY_DN8371_c0_g1_i1.p1  ORF type:complete len:178 (-),score=29.00 TRINITY_DN8371_c0_g1_i1:62-595(-)
MGAGAKKQVRNKKVLVVGEKGVGKTSLIRALVTGNPSIDQHESLVTDLHTKTVDTKTITWELQFAEMDEELPSNLKDFLMDCEDILLLFSPHSPPSIMKLQTIYDNLVHQKKTRYHVVSTKSDLEHTPLDEPCTQALGHLLRIIDTDCISTSSLTCDGIQRLNATLASMPMRRPKGG